MLNFYLINVFKKEKSIGDCAFIEHNNERFVFYLISKEFYYQKPLYSDLEKSLRRMLDLCKEKNVTKLAMPEIGCGLDCLQWSIVARIIDDVFNESNIEIQVYSLYSTKAASSTATATYESSFTFAH